MKIASWNVASIRARMPRLLEWLDESGVDLAALQETKVEDDKFPREELESRGWHLSIHGQKGYNGVAFLSRTPMEDVKVGFLPDWPQDCRVISGVLNGARFINTYVPNGTQVGTEKWEYKLSWLDSFPALLGSLASPDDKVVWLGDINVAPTPDDVFESPKHLGDVGHHPDEFERLARIVDWGWRDVFREEHAGPGHYTFWDFRMPNAYPRNLGWRIDHIYVTESLREACGKIWVDGKMRLGEKPSDHAPICMSLEI